MALLVLLALAGVAGGVGYYEAAKFEKRHDARRWGFSARLCGTGSFLAGLVCARFAAPLVLGAFVGYASYFGATTYERHNRERLWDISASLYAVTGVFFGLFGALFTSTEGWGILCLLLTLSGALLMLIDKNNALAAETERLRADNAKHNVSPPSRSATSSGPTASTPRPEPHVPVAQRSQQPDPQQQHQPTVARKTFLFGPPRPDQQSTDQPSPARSAAPPSGWSSSYAQPADDRNGTDLLPSRARPGTTERPHANDFLPPRR